MTLLQENKKILILKIQNNKGKMMLATKIIKENR
jgi:hypothetical protein